MNNFSLSIRSWYQENKRDLPWRRDRNPYQIWLSEIILQQTRVAQGLPYYEKFLAAYPTVKDFAEAKQDEILFHWQGLGYYSRGRNMHVAANQVLNDFDGVFPKDYKSLKSLKGVGDYTASAIGSFAFGLPTPVVDGNVYRVLSRYFGDDTPIDSGDGQKRFKSYAEELIDKENPGEHNQAIMELGALVCTPKKVECNVCPLNASCKANAENRIYEYPVKSKKIKVKERFFHYFHFQDSLHTYVVQRKGKGIWEGLFELPMLETKSAILECNNDVSSLEKVFETQHKLTHQKINAQFYTITDLDVIKDIDGIQKVEASKLRTFAFPKLINNYFDRMEKN